MCKDLELISLHVTYTYPSQVRPSLRRNSCLFLFFFVASMAQYRYPVFHLCLHPSTVLMIRKGNRDSLGIISHISP